MRNHTSQTPQSIASGPQEYVAGAIETLICFAHLRWDFVFQRPQHIMTRLADTYRVIYWEEPRTSPAEPHLELRVCPASGVTVATPLLPPDTDDKEAAQILKGLLDTLVGSLPPASLIRWYYTPLMLGFSNHLPAARVVYDCMDELANFKFAHPDLWREERALLAQADVVFTGGYSLFEAKKELHSNVLPFPSSVDQRHFSQARRPCDDPHTDGLSHPRIGFYGVIDERIDFQLLAAIAQARPHWTLIMVGPVVKVSPDDLPRADNLHYLGQRSYQELPQHLAHWDVAIMPFALNEATQFISPTKTPEYLAAGKPVVSTPIKDVVRHYGSLAAVQIAQNPAEFIAACEGALNQAASPSKAWRDEADRALSTLSWDRTVAEMRAALTAPRRVFKREEDRPRKPSGAGKCYDYLIVGAGFAGSVLAERLARKLDKRVLVVDKRPHIAGNAYDETTTDGLLYHKYGPHIFHTNSDDVFAYLSQFTAWRPYEHRVLAQVGDKQLPMPINRTTINGVFGVNLTTEAEAAAFLESQAEKLASVETSEDIVVSAVGRRLYEVFFRGYTRKQWGLDPSELDKSVAARVPARGSDDDRYFTDRRQAMPLNGYTRMFENMLDDPRITVCLDTDYEDLRNETSFTNVIYTGPIDAFFGYRFGALPYRSLRFEHVTLEQEWRQKVGTVNYPSEDIPYTRITEYKHLTGQKSPRTIITYEYPQSEGDPYYPIPRAENQALFKQYEALANRRPDVRFVGRLASYRYYNMDQVVAQALSVFRRIEADEARTPLARKSQAS